MQPPPAALFALAAFDADRPLDAEEVFRLERTLQVSSRWSLGNAVKVRVAMLVQGARGQVGVASLSGIPAGQTADHVAQQVDGALRQVARDVVNGVWVRNVTLVALEPGVRAVADAAAALRDLLEQVGPAPDRFGKILRLFLPLAQGEEPTPEDVARAAEKLRGQLRRHAAELARTAASPVSFADGTGGGGLADLLAALDGLGLPEDVARVAGQVRGLHDQMVRHGQALIAVQETLLPLAEELGTRSRAHVPGPLRDQLAAYVDRVLKPLSHLARLLK